MNHTKCKKIEKKRERIVDEKELYRRINLFQMGFIWRKDL